jgi:hypothetical protein
VLGNEGITFFQEWKVEMKENCICHDIGYSPCNWCQFKHCSCVPNGKISFSTNTSQRPQDSVKRES